MSAVATLVRQLAAIQDQLIALPDDAFAERFDLLRRQDELRAQAAHHADGADKDRPTEDLLAELVSLRIRRDTLESKHIDTMRQAANDDAANGMLRIEGRIGRIKGILIDRGVDPV